MDQQGDLHWPQAPVYDYSNYSVYTSLHADALDSEVENNLWRSARWCSDGSAIISTTEDKAIRVHKLSEDSSIETSTFKQPEAIVSSQWFPSASIASPATYCFIASCRDNPVKLIDANDGRVRATYPIVDHRERFISPHSLAFTPDSNKLYCGFEGAIEIFDISTPGPNSGDRFKTSFTKSSRDGQRGIISTIAFSTDYSGSFAAGSFDGTVGLYDEESEGATGWVEGVVGGGVTQVEFHPQNPHQLFVASRRSTTIQLYDLRDPSAPVTEFERNGFTNQRLWFDLDPWGRYLASGDEGGKVKVWNISSPDNTVVFEENLHQDAVGSVQFHPYYPLLLTCSGSRHIQSSYLEDDSDSSNSETDEDEAEDASRTRGLSGRDDSLKIHAFLPTPTFPAPAPAA